MTNNQTEGETMQSFKDAASGIGHYVVTVAAIVCITLLAMANKVDGNTAVAILAVAGGIAGGVGAAATGGKISATNTPVQQSPPSQMSQPVIADLTQTPFHTGGNS